MTPRVNGRLTSMDSETVLTVSRTSRFSVVANATTKKGVGPTAEE